jgi:hypothetical protein
VIDSCTDCKEYFSENHPFRSQGVVQDCMNSGQKQSFSESRSPSPESSGAWCVDAPFLLTLATRSSSLLWPFAVDSAVWIWNHLPDATTRLIMYEIENEARWNV